MFSAKETAVNIKNAQSQLWTTPWVASNGADNTSKLLTPLSQFPANPEFGGSPRPQFS